MVLIAALSTNNLNATRNQYGKEESHEEKHTPQKPFDLLNLGSGDLGV
jgi:hypothetical protein